MNKATLSSIEAIPAGAKITWISYCYHTLPPSACSEKMDDIGIEEILHHCAKCISRYEDTGATKDGKEMDMKLLSDLMDGLKKKISNMGDQWEGRCGHYFWFALKARIRKEENERYTSFKTARTRHWGFNSLIPSRKFSYDSSNLLIFEALKNYKKIHVVDFEIGAGIQWGAFIRRISTIPGGPPTLKISAIDGPGVFNEIAGKLTTHAEKYRVDLQFQDLSPLAESNHLLARKIMGCDQEGLAINLPFTMKQSTSPQNRQILRFVKELKPNVVILSELETTHDYSNFNDLFDETLRYYRIQMQTLDSQDWGIDTYRSIAECQTVVKPIIGVLAHNQIESPQPFSFWAQFFKEEGYCSTPPSAMVLDGIQKKIPRDPLYSLGNRDGALFLNWNDTPVVSCSAWTPRDSVAVASTSAAGGIAGGQM